MAIEVARTYERISPKAYEHPADKADTYTTTLVLLSQFLNAALPRSLLLGLPTSSRGTPASGRS
jgi:hypothetical protein